MKSWSLILLCILFLTGLLLSAMLSRRRAWDLKLLQRMFCLMLAAVFLFPVSAITAKADAKDDLVNFNKAKYIIVESRLKLKDATVEMLMKNADGNWVTDTASPFTFNTTAWNMQSGGATVTREADIYYKNTVKENQTNNASGHMVKITFPKAVLHDDGSYGALVMKLHTFRFQNASTGDKKNISFLAQTDGKLNFFSAVHGKGFTEGDIGVSYKVQLEVAGAAAGDRLFMEVHDLDQAGIGNTYGFGNYTEGIEMVSGVLDGPKVPDGHFLQIKDNQYMATKNTDGADSWLAAASWIADAQSSVFIWSGTNCATTFGIGKNDLPNIEVNYYVRQELANSPVNPASWSDRSFGDYWGVADRSFISVMLPTTWSYPYSADDFFAYLGLNSSSSWIYDFNGHTFSQKVTMNMSPKGEWISVTRRRYSYYFHANPPAGRQESDVTGMPGTKTVVADWNAKSDASVSQPSLSGYRFKGWTVNADGTGGAYPGSEVMMTDKHFYAQWERVAYVVRFDPNGGSNPNHEPGEFTQNTTAGAMADQEMEYDQWANLNANQFTREGYTFQGWNTKADGTGTAYTDQQSVCNLAGDKDMVTLYAQWAKKLGTETITVISEETGNPVSGVSMKLQKNVNGTWTDVTSGTTGNDGKIGVNNLHWFDWRWVITDVPAGYVRSADTAFRINYNLLSAENQVILYMKHVKIILDSQVSDIIKGEQAPAFLYQIEGTDAAGVNHKYSLLVQTDAASKFGSNQIPDLFAGTYTVTQMPVSRYNAETAVNISNGTVNGINASVDVLNHDLAEVKFPYTIREYGWYYGVNSVVNHLTK